MSPRAAWRLEGLGFEKVYDYVPGKADWSASGLPLKGTLARVPRIGDVARTDVPACAPSERIGAVRRRISEASWDRCVVVSRERVVLGLLRERELSSAPEASAEETMRNGPATFRADEPVEKIIKWMRERGTPAVLLTTPDGRLVGMLYREEAERPAAEGA